MTIKELKEELKKYDETLPVFLASDEEENEIHGTCGVFNIVIEKEEEQGIFLGIVIVPDSISHTEYVEGDEAEVLLG